MLEMKKWCSPLEIHLVAKNSNAVSRPSVKICQKFVSDHHNFSVSITDITYVRISKIHD